MISLKIVRNNEMIIAEKSSEKETYLPFENTYEQGDKIVVECDNKNEYLMIQLDDAIGAAFILLKDGQMEFEIPFGEKKVCYSPKSFLGEKHLLFARLATPEEIGSYKNVALNPYDTHETLTSFPHASANVETRGESVFAAKNAINGNRENHSHGNWPYESWGINQNPNAKMKIEFGRSVEADKIIMYTRADFPHDSWWTQVTLTFSDGSELEWNLEKTDKAHVLHFDKKNIMWVEISNLMKADDESPFPALTQFEVYGLENNV